MIRTDGTINQDCVINKIGFNIQGQIFHVDEDGLIMHEEPNGCDSDSDVYPKNYLNTYDDVEIEADEFLIKKIPFMNKNNRNMEN